MGPPGSRDTIERFVFDADPSVQAGRSEEHAPPPDSHPGRARGVLPAVAVIVLLTVAVAIGGLAETPTSSASPSPTATVAPVADCTRTSLTAVPVFALGIAGGAGAGIGGSIGTTYLPGEVHPGVAWQRTDVEPGRDIPVVRSGEALEVRSLASECIRQLTAEYADATLADAPLPAELRPLRRGTVDPPSATPSLGTLPDGDWVVRVQADFETGVSGRQGWVSGERFFRVRVGPGPFPTPARDPDPEVTPAVACGPAPSSPEDVALTLTAPDGEPVPGVVNGTDAPTVAIPLGETGTLAVVGDACARSWDVTVFDAETGRAFRADVVRNPNDDPDRAAQNRWRVWSTVGDFFLVAKLHFGPGIDLARVWRIEGPGFTVPETWLIAADGRRSAALPGCDLTFTRPNGYTVTDACPSPGLPDGLRLLRVPAWSRVDVEVPGWAITSWDGSCHPPEDDPAAVGMPSQATVCALGGYTVANGSAPPGPVQFLARPGEWAVWLHVRAERAGTTYDVPMYALVVGE